MNSMKSLKVNQKIFYVYSCTGQQKRVIKSFFKMLNICAVYSNNHIECNNLKLRRRSKDKPYNILVGTVEEPGELYKLQELIEDAKRDIL